MLTALLLLIGCGTLLIGLQHARYQRDTRAQMQVLLDEARGDVATLRDLLDYVRAVEQRLAALEARVPD